MSLFGNLSTEGTEAVEDRLGGGFAALDTAIYTGNIKMAYAGESSGGARSVTVILSGGDFKDKEYRETLYVTSGREKGQTNTYTKDGKKYLLPSFITMNHLCLATIGKELSEMIGEDKMVNVYDAEQKKEMPKSVPVLTELLGQEVSLAIVNTTELQTTKDANGNYVAKGDGSTKNTNTIEKVFHTASKMTISEAEAKQKDPSIVAEFWDKWAEKNTGKTRDKTTAAAKGTGTAGKPGGGAPAAGAAAGGGAPRSSLFSK